MKKVWYAPNKLEAYGEEEIKAVEQCLRDGWLAGFGPRSIEFEEKIAKEFGKKYGVFVNSGSSACLLAIAALDLPKGSKIITPALTFSTTDAKASGSHAAKLAKIFLFNRISACFNPLMNRE